MSVLTCSCGVTFKRQESAIKPGKSYFHSKECRRAATEGDGVSRCAKCKEWLPTETFPWVLDARYTAGGHRSAYCPSCKNSRARKYHQEPTNKEKARQHHDAWRERNLTAGGDSALRWYFTRHLGAYRKRTRDAGLPPCDLNADFLVALFHQQSGCCYFTGEMLVWQNYGKGKGGVGHSTLSLDRLIPSRGYVQGNVVLCTYLTNTSKGDRTEEDFYAFCEQILRLHSEKTHSTPIGFSQD